MQPQSTSPHAAAEAALKAVRRRQARYPAGCEVWQVLDGVAAEVAEIQAKLPAEAGRAARAAASAAVPA